MACSSSTNLLFDIVFCSYGAICWIISSLLEAGLTLTHFKEYPYSWGFKPFKDMQHVDNRWYLPADQPNLPFMFSLAAQKPGR